MREAPGSQPVARGTPRLLSSLAHTTIAVAPMLAALVWLGTWSKTVDCYIVVSEFARAKYIGGGLSAEKTVVKPNFVTPSRTPAPGVRTFYGGS